MVSCGYEQNRPEIMLIAPRGKHLAFALGSWLESRNLQDVGHAERSQLTNLPRALVFIRQPAADEFPILSAWRVSENRDLLRDTASDQISGFERSSAAGVERHNNDVSRTNRPV